MAWDYGRDPVCKGSPQPFEITFSFFLSAGFECTRYSLVALKFLTLQVNMFMMFELQMEKCWVKGVNPNY